MWSKVKGDFCPYCNSTYDTIDDAKSACEQDQDCKAVYDLFCDAIGYFCICPHDSIAQQVHPRGIDCIHWKRELNI